jgi:hypothetical protein
LSKVLKLDWEIDLGWKQLLFPHRQEERFVETTLRGQQQKVYIWKDDFSTQRNDATQNRRGHFCLKEDRTS